MRPSLALCSLLVLSLLALSTPRSAGAQTATPPTITPAPSGALKLDGADSLLCERNATTLPVTGSVTLNNVSEARLQYKRVITLQSQSGSSIQGDQDYQYQTIAGSSTFTIDLSWPGVQTGDTEVKTHVSVNLVDMNGTLLVPQGDQRTYHWRSTSPCGWTSSPTSSPTSTAVPTSSPTSTAVPTSTPTSTAVPTSSPTSTAVPTSPAGSDEPKPTPDRGPIDMPKGRKPTPTPTVQPTVQPTKQPTAQPTSAPQKPNTPAAPHKLYLPVVKNRPPMPDLIISAAEVRNGQMRITITNQGDGPVTAPFWTVVSVSEPVRNPYASTSWSDFGLIYMSWQVPAGQLPPGASLTLSTTDRSAQGSVPFTDYVQRDNTRFYAQVDAFSRDSDLGAVVEIDELDGYSYNNLKIFSSGSSASSAPGLPNPQPSPRR